MLVRRERPRVNVDVRIDLNRSDVDATSEEREEMISLQIHQCETPQHSRVQQRAERARDDALADATDDTAGDEDVLHGRFCCC